MIYQVAVPAVEFLVLKFVPSAEDTNQQQEEQRIHHSDNSSSIRTVDTPNSFQLDVNIDQQKQQNKELLATTNQSAKETYPNIKRLYISDYRKASSSDNSQQYDLSNLKKFIHLNYLYIHLPYDLMLAFMTNNSIFKYIDSCIPRYKIHLAALQHHN